MIATVKCDWCGKITTKYRERLYPKMFCNQTCKTAHSRSNPKAKYQTTSINGKTKAVHVIIAEKTIGRKLRRGENVHHKDKNTRNNDPSNLEVLTTHEHALEHPQIKWDLELAKEMAADGSSISKIAKTIGVQYQDIWAAFDVRGIKTTGTRKHGTVDASKVKILFENGMSYREIARVMGISRVSVFRALKSQKTHSLAR